MINYPIEDGLERRKREVGTSVRRPLSCPDKKKMVDWTRMTVDVD